MAVDTSMRTPSAATPQTKESENPTVPIKAWYYNDNDDLPSKPHQYSPNREVSIDHLQKLGVLTWTQIEADGYENNRFLNKIKAVRGYNYEEVLTVAPGKLPNFEANTKKFFMEHLHDHEEIRFILDGIGYEDVRDFDGQWIRIEIKKGDLIVLPPGMYHRFTLDEKQYLKALLLYQGTPKRIQFEKYPETDSMEVRLDYVQSVLERELQSPSERQLISESMNQVLAATTKAMEVITV
ncbi:uncharacterized protein [Physcomitrium patens]|uniref:uncharacterized protein isoform X2 n=1 Tax=Physcomitrium patens TaxID=3218 RepID=UPI00024AC3B7|nr:1,2-dihydroxy-3-keto-5-methylthiopentene dioxygenase-like isoform X2 [Physcomitrium patens]XP_024369908.1 1,2-dihydroxy-3-keto-5-methylthiopentene dioxygenase-like isoform X2 [Physcomitrium patens]XP_024369909.1 1,2-dihydroxy-3-keto-5-methylthiopentene dioxygenase-like isoform X2 [Physcomitrium patens]XP_024369910.1 1,2-dihydroxy-3-keto-5-methylthiopentene dioxygenase-like isoform X2 [Physcomitrium patens]|eukprot:XP_024369907.1 1,2-dihydroxy-3-keto-5-methylthiopentene dioxygenase-like isoform X2 [Physcomitrella patens]